MKPGLYVRRLCWMGALVLAATLVPAAGAQAAEEERELRGSIFIHSDRQFTEHNGVRSGSGTMQDPYVISGWAVTFVHVENTTKHVLIEDNLVRGTMTLDWMGPGVTVRNNDISNLIVNQNVPRTGAPTSGVIAGNNIGLVEQLRHWDGVFENNVVGDPTMLTWRAVNFDGFNGARFRNNTIYGYVEARLHGHHHSSSFSSGSHNHSSHSTMVSHTHRYHRVAIEGNTIYSLHRYGLAYTDTDHSANDRTAASETNPALNGMHVHHTSVLIEGNRLVGTGILIEVFNAYDSNHLAAARGALVIRGNEVRVTLPDMPTYLRRVLGIYVERARDVNLDISGNRIHGADADGSDPLNRKTSPEFGGGILLDKLDRAAIVVATNDVSDRVYGVRARNMTGSVTWTVRDLRTSNVKQDVYWDDTVANPPRRDA